MMVIEYTRLRPFHKNDLAPLVEFWNNAFVDRRNFYPISASDFQNRVLDCDAFDPDGLILAWHDGQDGTSQLVGLVHALRPAPKSGLYARWEQRHDLALLYVDPAYRRQGIGSRLLKAAENWLYYCPVHVGGPAQPCYGMVEGPRPPFFGGSQSLGITVHDGLLIRFLANRGYHIVDPGEVSMRLKLTPQIQPQGQSQPEPPMPDLAAKALRLVPISHEMPFVGREPKGREEYTLYGNNGGAPYWGYVLVSADNLLQAHISYYPMHQTSSAAIAGFWVAPSLRGEGLGRYLLDRTLYDLVHATPQSGGYDTVPQSGEFATVPQSGKVTTIPQTGEFTTVEVQTHLVKHAQAAALYERRGFEVEMAWVQMSKECAVRGVKAVGLSAY